MESEKLSHKSFGQIQFNRVSGHAEFYGSELTQDHYINLEISESHVYRTLEKDRYRVGDPIVRVRMTAGQFAELITSLNTGTGVPCTIEAVGTTKTPKILKQTSRKEYVHETFRERMEEFAKQIVDNNARAKEIIAKKTLTKDDQLVLSRQLDAIVSEIADSIPYYVKCFQEATDKVTHEAKLEVENAIQHKLTMLGMQVMAAKDNLLLEENTNNNE